MAKMGVYFDTLLVLFASLFEKLWSHRNSLRSIMFDAGDQSCFVAHCQLAKKRKNLKINIAFALFA